MRALREDLERVLDGRPVTAHAPTWSYWTGKAVRRNKLLTAVTAALLVALGAATWFAIQSRLTRDRQETMESAFDRTLKSLNSNLDRWSDPNQHVTVAEKTEVVKSAAGLLKDETLKKVAARGDRPQLVSRVVNGVEGVLSRAEGLAGKETPVHKDVSVAYRIVGDFRLVVASTSGGRKDDAVKSYEHAAAAARQVSRSDLEWARATLQELSVRLGRLGQALDVPSYLDVPAPERRSLNPLRSSGPSRAGPAGRPCCARGRRGRAPRSVSTVEIGHDRRPAESRRCPGPGRGAQGPRPDAALGRDLEALANRHVSGRGS